MTTTEPHDYHRTYACTTTNVQLWGDAFWMIISLTMAKECKYIIAGGHKLNLISPSDKCNPLGIAPGMGTFCKLALLRAKSFHTEDSHQTVQDRSNLKHAKREQNKFLAKKVSISPNKLSFQETIRSSWRTPVAQRHAIWGFQACISERE